MRAVLTALLSVLLVFYIGCKKDSDNNPAGPPLNPANVAFAITHQQGQTGMEFYAKPSVNVKITRVIVSFPAQQYSDTMDNPLQTYVFSKDTAYLLGIYTGVQNGQQWTFHFIGTVAVGGTAFDVTVSYTVQTIVTFQISSQQGGTGTQFLAKPSVDVKITRVIVSLPAQPYSDTLNNPLPAYVFSKDSTYVVGEYTGVHSGQQWQFRFSGSVTPGGTVFDVTSNYPVP